MSVNGRVKIPPGSVALGLWGNVKPKAQSKKGNKMESANQIISQLTGYFENAQTLFWASFAILTIVGAGLLAAGCRYYKRLLFVVGAVPTYIVIHCLAAQFGWSEGWAIFGGLLVGVLMILLSWLYIYTWGFWTAVAIVGALVTPFLDVSGFTAMDWFKYGWMLAVVGVAGGCLALIKQRHIIIFVTALTGSAFFVFGALVLLAGANAQMFATMSPKAFVVTLGLLYLVFAGIGVFVQYKYTAKRATVVVEGEDGTTTVVVKKSKFLYVCLACTLGYIGVHSMYAGRYVKGSIQMVIAATAGFFNFIPLVFTVIWALCSAFRASKNLGLVAESKA